MHMFDINIISHMQLFLYYELLPSILLNTFLLLSIVVLIQLHKTVLHEKRPEL